MDQNKINDNPSPKEEAFPHFFAKKDNMIAIYTAMCILRKMKQQLSIDAMHEYLDSYVCHVGEHNPKLGFAVEKALSFMCVEKMYKDAMGEKAI